MWRLACVVLVVAACGDDGQVPVDGSRIDHPSVSLGGPLFIIQSPTDEGPLTVIGGFFGPDLFTTLSSRDEGPCRVYRTASNNSALHSAGQMRISGGGGLVMLPAGTSYQDSVMSYRYAGGETLLIEAMGATVPAFTQTFTFPHPLTLLTTSVLLYKSREFTATWTPEDSDVLVRFTQNQPDLTIDCTFPGSLGTGTIPASAFSDLVTTQPGGMLITTHAHADAEAGDYAIALDTYFHSVAPSSFTVRD